MNTEEVEEQKAVGGAGNWRWMVCGLLFFAATVNYVDRQVIGILKVTLQQELHWSEIDYSNIILGFQVAYAAGSLLVGRLIDRLGTRRGYSLAVIVWSIAAMAHAAARSVAGFAIARAALGLGEGGSFPASVKSVAEWFPKKERALATGIFNAGTNIGALVTPLTVPWITIQFGWKWAFLITGGIGMLWVIAWLALYRSPGEKGRGVPGPPMAEEARKIPWRKLVPHRQMWAIAMGKFMTDPIWWVYLFWIPDFLNRAHGITLSHMGAPLVVIYQAASVGSVGGGWIPAALIKRGWSVNRARKTAMLICACGVVPIVLAARVSSLWMAVGIIGLATASHQGWSANMYTLASDMFPGETIGSVIGMATMAGAVGGMLIAKLVGYILQWTGSYSIIFGIAGGAYLLAFAVIQALAPKLEPVRIAG